MVHAKEIQIHTGETMEILFTNNLDLSTLNAGEKKRHKKDRQKRHKIET